MAPNATLYHLEVELSDVDRACYQTLDLRVARHPSESLRYLTTRALAYCLSYEEGIGFSKGGLSSTEEPPVLVRDATGRLVLWIEVGAPSAERMHKASKACARVALYTATDLEALRSEATAGRVHHAERIDVWTLDPAFLDALEPKLERSLRLGLVRTDGQLYVTVNGATVEGELQHSMLAGAS